MAKRRYWLMKSEPDVFSFEDLKSEPKKTACWEGVRNYQARNFMRDEMKKGDGVLFYHSNTKPPGVAGIAEIAREGYVDHYQFDKKSKYFDPKADPDNPRWFMVDVKYKKPFQHYVSLPELRENPALKDMLVIQRGQRLSIQPVSEKEWKAVLKMGGITE